MTHPHFLIPVTCAEFRKAQCVPGVTQPHLAMTERVTALLDRTERTSLNQPSEYLAATRSIKSEKNAPNYWNDRPSHLFYHQTVNNAAKVLSVLGVCFSIILCLYRQYLGNILCEKKKSECCGTHAFPSIAFFPSKFERIVYISYIYISL